MTHPWISAIISPWYFVTSKQIISWPALIYFFLFDDQFTIYIPEVEEIAREHDSRLTVDCTRAYHFGARCEHSFILLFFYFFSRHNRAFSHKSFFTITLLSLSSIWLEDLKIWVNSLFFLGRLNCEQKRKCYVLGNRGGFWMKFFTFLLLYCVCRSNCVASCDAFRLNLVFGDYLFHVRDHKLNRSTCAIYEINVMTNITIQSILSDDYLHAKYCHLILPLIIYLYVKTCITCLDSQLVRNSYFNLCYSYFVILYAQIT